LQQNQKFQAYCHGMITTTLKCKDYRLKLLVKFLARRSHAFALLTSAQSEEEYFQIMKQLLQSIKDND
jgi:hypothetical protein